MFPEPSIRWGRLCASLLVLYLQHLRVGQVLAILSAQLLTQRLQLSAKQDDPFCGCLVAPAELPPWMPVVCTPRPAENTLESEREGKNSKDPTKLQCLD